MVGFESAFIVLYGFFVYFVNIGRLEARRRILKKYMHTFKKKS